FRSNAGFQPALPSAAPKPDFRFICIRKYCKNSYVPPPKIFLLGIHKQAQQLPCLPTPLTLRHSELDSESQIEILTRDAEINSA
ncbi:MAG: hypothetical protein IKN90_00990, partial [Treponema sp.]|nr:hypothetical protein [Treponema sp.]